MSHTYSSLLFHCVFSTKNRTKSIPAEIQTRLWAYMAGLAREHRMKALAIGGAEDHVHMLLSLPTSMPVANAIREIKSWSSFWVRRTCAIHDFAWQEGFGAFSIGQTQVDATLNYIAGQAEHHRKRDFQAEFLAFLSKHRLEYDPKFVWG